MRCFYLKNSSVKKYVVVVLEVKEICFEILVSICIYGNKKLCFFKFIGVIV